MHVIYERRRSGGIGLDRASSPGSIFHNIGEALTALSRVDPNVSWTRDPQGLLRVRDDRVRDDVLRIHLKRVHFSGTVDPNEAIWSVLAAPEVRAYFKKNNIEDSLIFNHLSGVGTKGLPKLSGDLHDVTVAEALDRIMKFFHGLWIYGECSKGSIKRMMVKGISTGLPGTNGPLAD